VPCLTIGFPKRQADSDMAQSSYFNDILAPEADAPRQPGQKKRETAHRIFRSAIELMQDEGFDGVSIEKICERAGIARATFFKHFANKAAIFSVFSDIICERLDEELSAQDLTPKERLTLIADHLQRLIDELGAVAPDMLAAFTSDPAGGFKLDEPNTGITQRIMAIIKDGQSDGTFADHWSAEDIAISLASAWVGVSRRRLVSNSEPNERLIHRVLDLILNGISA